MSSDYEKILEQAWSEVPEVQLLPRGSWLLKVRTAQFVPPKTAEGNLSALIVYEAKEPMDDVSDDDLEALGKDYNPADNRIFHRMWLGDGADWQAFRNFLTKHGIDPNEYTRKESIAAIKGLEVVGFVDQETYKDKTQNVIKSFTAVE